MAKALEEGQYIKHSQYGCGVVTDSSRERTIIDFDRHGSKKFVTSLLVVQPAEGAPPARSHVEHGKAAKSEAAPATLVGAV
jgi:hypothetical protein